MSADCLFCKIIAGELPSNKVYSDEEVIAFEDIAPAAPTHILVIPTRHIGAINEVEADDQALLGKLLLVANNIARERGLDDDGFRYVINTGEDGGQTVGHIHLHILAGRQMTWPPG